MRVRKILWPGIGLLFSVVTMAVSATDIMVPPGVGTLAAAVAGASNGDVLILQYGNYDLGAGVTVDKSLHIRAVDHGTLALVSENLIIDGPGIEVTIQGLTFADLLRVVRGSSVSILQNHFTSLGPELDNYKSSEGDGRLLIIGNKLDNGDIKYIRSNNAYIAGNSLLSGRIESSGATLTWIVGNNVRASGGQAIRLSGDFSRVIANRVTCDGSSNFEGCISTIISRRSVVTNNIVKTRSTANFTLKGITASDGTVTNNVIRSTNSSGLENDIGIDMVGDSVASGNIILGFGGPVATSITSAQFYNNVCVNLLICPTGNLDLDPKFADLVDYRLMATSPAIDAGPSDPELADIDRSRNDAGAYGGPWSIDQYDSQRDPSNYAPYVYPLFQGGSAFSGGTLNLQALGVAKLR